MRLAQLARKLAIRPTEIVEFLTEHNLQIEDGSNTRLEDDHVNLIMQKFAPSRAAEVAAELATEKETIIETPVIKETADIITLPISEESNLALTTSANESTADKIEVIKAPKVELSGLKVVGKIELPEPKKKETQPESDQPLKVEPTPIETEKRPRQENRKPHPGRKETNDQFRKNPIAQQRERDALEAEKRRRAKVESEKEKRTQHYLNKVKVAAPTKSVRLMKEEVEEMVALAPVPKTWWGRFMKWLNT